MTTSAIKVGDRFGRGTVVEIGIYYQEGATTKRYGSRLVCQCGSYYLAANSKLKNGHTRSCGCLAQETRSRNGKSNTTHGMTNHPMYETWANMMTRCYNSNFKEFHRYGGRGITVCDQWHDVRRFISDIETLLGPKPSPEMTLDRINNNGNYQPDNVRWATRLVQNNNVSAKGNGYFWQETTDVAERGRIPAEITEAYERSQGNGHKEDVAIPATEWFDVGKVVNSETESYVS